MRREHITLCLALLLAVSALGSAAEAQRAAVRTAVVAEPDTIALAHIERAFRSGDVSGLLVHATEPLDLAIYGHGASYTRSQAALVLTDFFRRNPPAQVSFREEVAAEDRRSVIGQYATANSDPSAVFVRLRVRDGRWEIRSIRIERAGRR